MTGYPPPPGPPGPPPGPPPGYTPPPSSGPPPSYGPPASYGPPPGYGAPPGYPSPPTAQASQSSFDPKSVNILDWGIFGGAVLALIFSFFKYYTASVNLGGVTNLCRQQATQAGVDPSLCDTIGSTSGLAGKSDSASAWHGFFGWFGVLLLLAAAFVTAVAVFAPRTKMPAPVRLVALGAAALGLLCTLIALFVDPSVPTSGSGLPAGVNVDDIINIDRGVSYWIVLILAAAVAVAALLRFQQSGGQLPGLGAKNAAPSYGAPPAAPGYGPPPAQPGQWTPPPAQPTAPQAPPSYAPPPAYGPPAPQAPPSFGPPPQAPPPPAGSVPPTEQTTVVPNWPPPGQPPYQPPPTG